MKALLLDLQGKKTFRNDKDFVLLITVFVRNLLHMDIRLEDMVLHKTSGLKQQWQFSPWITSHRFQLPLRWYARVRLIRHTFMSSATKHLASQRDAHLLLRTIRPPAAWRNVSWASSPLAAARQLNVLSWTWTADAPAGQVMGTGRQGRGHLSVGWQLLPTHRCSEPRWLRFFFSPSWGVEAAIPKRSSNLVMSSGDKWRISHLNHNLDCKPSSRRQFLQALQCQRFIPFNQRFTSDDNRRVLVLAIVLIISLSRNTRSLIPLLQFPATLARVCFW